jgi:hypothetical protein
MELKKQLSAHHIIQHTTTRWQYSEDEIKVFISLRKDKWSMKQREYSDSLLYNGHVDSVF